MIKHTKWLMYGMVTAWIVLTVVAFWWFQFKNMTTFSPAPAGEQQAYFQSSGLAQQLTQLSHQLKESAINNEITVVHFWNPDCLCNRFNNEHVRNIIETYETQGVRFFVIPSTTKNTSYDTLEAEVKTHFGSKVNLVNSTRLNLPSSPAAAVINREGQLSYFGPYSTGAACSATSGAFVEATLNSMLAGKQPHHINMTAVGCYCNWKHWRQHNVI